MSIDDHGARPLGAHEADELAAIAEGLGADIHLRAALRHHEEVAPIPPRRVVAASLLLGCAAIGIAAFLGGEPLAAVVIMLVLACTLAVVAVAGSRGRR